MKNKAIWNVSGIYGIVANRFEKQSDLKKTSIAMRIPMDRQIALKTKRFEAFEMVPMSVGITPNRFEKQSDLKKEQYVTYASSVTMESL